MASASGNNYYVVDGKLAMWVLLLNSIDIFNLS